MGRGGTAARQDEILESRQRLVELIEHLFEMLDLFSLDCLRARNAQLAAQIEQVVLDFREAPRDVRRQIGNAEDHADGAVGFVHRAIGLDTDVILSNAGSISEAGGAVVACARVDLAQAIAHTGLRVASSDYSKL